MNSYFSFGITPICISSNSTVPSALVVLVCLKVSTRLVYLKAASRVFLVPFLI